jgi:hypothetical protein
VHDIARSPQNALLLLVVFSSDVKLCIAFRTLVRFPWDTRVADFETFVKNTGYDATADMYSLGKDWWEKGGVTWREPDFIQGSNHPVVGV